MTYRMFLVSCSEFLWRFQSLETDTPKKYIINDKALQIRRPAAAECPLNFAHFLPLLSYYQTVLT